MFALRRPSLLKQSEDGPFPLYGLLAAAATAAFWLVLLLAEARLGNADGHLVNWPLLPMLVSSTLLAGTYVSCHKWPLGQLAGVLAAIIWVWFTLQVAGWHLVQAQPLAGLEQYKASFFSLFIVN